jgi:NAD(P)-dependent dehydrogenase (short-subunit alcohol dehydrogenase family)
MTDACGAQGTDRRFRLAEGSTLARGDRGESPGAGRRDERTPRSRGAVLVSGCSSGIGRACAVRLSRAGFRVFAGVRDVSDAPPNRGTPVVLDVSSCDSVARAAAFVSDHLEGAPLVGVVNNAGVSAAGPLAALPLAAVRQALEVNLMGPLRVARDFLPMLRTSRGRVVNIGSGEAFCATPFNGAYCMSKHALEAQTECLRLELAPEGVAVCIVEPGQTDTAILRKVGREFDELEDRLRGEGLQSYALGVRARAAMSARPGMPPDRVAAAVERALTARNPRARYFVGSNVRAAAVLGRFFPARLRDRIFVRLFGFPGG